MRNIKNKIEKINSILDEIKSYEIYKEHLQKKLDKIFLEYQQGYFDHETYKKKRDSLLENKTKKEWFSYYSAYIYSLLKQVEELNYEIFYEAYENKDFMHIKPIKVAKPEKKVEAKESVKQPLKQPIKHEVLDIKGEVEEKKQEKELKEIIKAEKKEQEKIKIEIKEEPLKIPRPQRTAKKQDLEKILRKRQSKIGIGSTFGINFMKLLVKRFSKKTEARKTILDLKLKSNESESLFEKTDVSQFSNSMIAEEARRIKNILEVRKTASIYQPSFFGALANVFIKRVSFFLLDNFPDVFKNLYDGLRLSNIKVLSNTYVNIMVLFVILSSIISLPLTLVIFAKSNPFIGTAVVKSLFVTLLIAISVFIGFYAYPFMKIKERKRNINSNLSFAINHMAAVASSGVPPTRMFHLIADSTEYGEVSIEIAKIVEYIELFGYDFMTALRSVSAISPSPQFKEFLEGLVSTIESGGDAKEYLSQKADEAMLNYELEREKYTESISTYSDIYTGILIAAPLFFVTALSMVSILGGSVGGIDVNVLTLVGTYFIVPLLNVAFLVFLNMTQPEV